MYPAVVGNGIEHVEADETLAPGRDHFAKGKGTRALHSRNKTQSYSGCPGSGMAT